MYCEIIVNVNLYETRIAILEDNLLVELFAEKKEKELIVGNIYKGIIKNVLPGMGAAFVDIGLARTAFLHFKDIDPNTLTKVKKKIYNRRDSSLIGKIIQPNQEIVVQVKKDPIGKKGARVTGKLSIPGKFLVLMPHQKKIAISRKISSSKEKNRIKKIFENLKDDSDGIIVRTDTEGIVEEDFEQEYNGLNRTWKLVEKQIKHAKGPACIYDENDLSFTLVRDLFNSSVERLVVDDKKLRQRIVSRMKNITPELIDRIELYNEDSPIFDAFGIEKEISTIFNSRVNLPSGGNITIEQTEALVAVDVNTGSFTGSGHYEQTIEHTNVEAAKEIARQIRLRDLSGIMVIDFIDMRSEDGRDNVYDVFKTAMKRDRAKNKVFPINQLGLLNISRKRSRPSLLLSYSEQCPHCHGTGRLLSRDSVTIQISRWLQRANYFIKNDPLKVYAHRNVINFINENTDIFDNISNKIEFIIDHQIESDKFRVISSKTNKDITLNYSI
ncbi:MAG: Rne/Rng family ribonuclease [Candidatus Cloacimonetes bacterium]|nr:Rne/Rng family ribonuclease [Candidatus Cloacimonadota bacterium]MCF7813801.1 Rne/Rng family ribonuclease [Candidatus Cloacimonadota bacterium]MCF7868480.1 Rne/Rng family ribonuclease [Candidatus Cloacimonadota bacterium]